MGSQFPTKGESSFEFPLTIRVCALDNGLSFMDDHVSVSMILRSGVNAPLARIAYHDNMNQMKIYEVSFNGEDYWH